jgi:hypothetical protein
MTISYPTWINFLDAAAVLRLVIQYRGIEEGQFIELSVQQKLTSRAAEFMREGGWREPEHAQGIV